VRRPSAFGAPDEAAALVVDGKAFATAVGCAVLEETARPGFLAGVAEAGAHRAERLTELSQQYQCGEVRGHGLLLALNFESEVGPDWRCGADF
jgi:acetylornithine/succinyldiaminopimelate/putrescine aminotransferase